ncbi:MAG: hypothetical protein JST00_41515 [Deltaproteobacteria bacterium]|nr:hypothetical protein [Deltaproteobacteria bacterium]
MRTTIGLLTGFAAIGLIACTETIVQRSGTPGTDPTTPGGGDTTTGDPATDPSQQGDPTSPDAPSPPLVAGLAITDVAIFQAVKVPLVTDGKAATTRNAPVIVGRPGLVRVYVKPGAGYAGGEVTAELRLVDGTTRLPILKDTKTISRESTDEDTSSTFNFEVPATSLPKGVSYQVFLTAKGGTVQKAGAVDQARFPASGGVQALDPEVAGKLKLVIVPVKYDADGSGRVPDTSAAQMDLYRQTFMARYAAEDVEITVRQPLSWASAISANGSGFSQILNAITNLRRTDGAAADVYYYGAFAPRSSFSTFCGGGCVTGLSSVAGLKTPFMRASVGVGFPGQDTANTAAHEVGHAHGREHAPCGGAGGPDADYPYSGGVIGVWGYNILTKQFISPSRGHDMMGYCPNEWVSDYTFTALFDRIAQVNGFQATSATGSSNTASAAMAAVAHGVQTYRTTLVNADGSLEEGGTFELTEAPDGGELRAATFVSATGQTLGQRDARFYPYDHLPGGVLVTPVGTKDAQIASWASVKVSGLSRVISR